MTTDNKINEFEVLHQTESKEMQDSNHKRIIKSVTKRESSTYHLKSGEKNAQTIIPKSAAGLHTVPIHGMGRARGEAGGAS